MLCHWWLFCPMCCDSNGFKGFLRVDLLLLLTHTCVQLHFQQSTDLRPGRTTRITLINTNPLLFQEPVTSGWKWDIEKKRKNETESTRKTYIKRQHEKGMSMQSDLSVPGSSLCISFSQYCVVMVTWLRTNKHYTGARGYFSHGTS